MGRVLDLLDHTILTFWYIPQGIWWVCTTLVLRQHARRVDLVETNELTARLEPLLAPQPPVDIAEPIVRNPEPQPEQPIALIELEPQPEPQAIVEPQAVVRPQQHPSSPT